MLATGTRTGKVTITLPRRQADLLADGLDDASGRIDNAGWCWCSDVQDCGICPTCAENFDRAYIYRDYRNQITAQLGTDPDPVALTFDTRSWREIAAALSIGADHLADSCCLDCTHRNPCDDCLEQRSQAPTYRALRTRLARQLRHPRRPRGTRARSRNRR
ncbi:hypothetical protein AB0F88_17200 [Streptosporangium sp. NPDC023963]|uniref:hypothetical protein n=1 Tax=Streptosporangium sp. NPDC023963 TaxID=3155608 RepID=UPI003430DF3D